MNIGSGISLTGNVPGTNDESRTNRIQSVWTSLSEEELLDQLKNHFPLALAIKNITTSSSPLAFFLLQR